MKMILRSTLAAAVLAAGAAALLPTAASAGVDISVGVGVPGVYATGPGYSPYEGQMYYDPIFYDGSWYHGPYRWRMEDGQRVFWLNGGWHRNEWQGGAIPGSLTFHNGGYYRGGRYDGFNDADRINARFHGGNGAMHEDRRDQRQDRPDAGPADAGHDRADGPHN
jgi:hypothetical protein